MDSKKSLINATPSVKARLAKLGIERLEDIVLHLPYRYDDETSICDIANLKSGRFYQIQGIVQASKVLYRPKRQISCYIKDNSGLLQIRLFNFYPNQQKALAEGSLIRAFGEVRFGSRGLEMLHPKFKKIEKKSDLVLPSSLTPVYPSSAGLKQATFRRLAKKALANFKFEDTIPEVLRENFGLMSFKKALDILHNPCKDIDVESLSERKHPAWSRLKFDELLAQQLCLKVFRRKKDNQKAYSLKCENKLSLQLTEKLTFKLTEGQSSALSEIRQDLMEEKPMHRLLQGDVGSGKTVVAAFAALQAIESGFQVAVMAPTEILAEQHFQNFASWLVPLKIEVDLLIGGQRKSEREVLNQKIASGKTSLVVGTHALFQKTVKFENLALIIVDEQHRFGVNQRLALRNKGFKDGKLTLPHQLMMTATPIPRTLAMSYYADLDVSLIRNLPAGRKPVKMKILSRQRKNSLIKFVKEVCASGEQVYWVCPLVEEGGNTENPEAHNTLQSVEKTVIEIKKELKEFTVGLVHGRLAKEEKAEVMRRFIARQINVLVATTVIEVGVDVPNANLMVIENAERMGLSQLHQLRGRIGRGVLEGTCVLLYQSPVSDIAKKRLQVIYEMRDGFKVAEQDLRLRGPGEFVGVKQSGLPVLRFAELDKDKDLLEMAISVANHIIDNHSEIIDPHVSRWLGSKLPYLEA